jgi:hypothetical protein
MLQAIQERYAGQMQENAMPLIIAQAQAQNAQIILRP